jgi:hypothetical protein
MTVVSTCSVHHVCSATQSVVGTLLITFELVLKGCYSFLLHLTFTSLC